MIKSPAISVGLSFSFRSDSSDGVRMFREYGVRMYKEYTYTFPVKPGPWRAEAKFPFPVKTVFSIALRDSAGNRVESGLPDDLVIHVDGNSYPVHTASMIRSDMRYPGRPGDIGAPGGQEAGMISIDIKIPAESEIHFHATWPETLEPGASLTVIAMENK